MSEEKVNVVPPVVNSIEEEGADSKNPRNITRNGFEPTDEDQRQEPVNISSKRRKLKRKNDSISPPPECVSDACFPSREEVSVGKEFHVVAMSEESLNKETPVTVRATCDSEPISGKPLPVKEEEDDSVTSESVKEECVLKNDSEDESNFTSQKRPGSPKEESLVGKLRIKPFAALADQAAPPLISGVPQATRPAQPLRCYVSGFNSPLMPGPSYLPGPNYYSPGPSMKPAELNQRRIFLAHHIARIRASLDFPSGLAQPHFLTRCVRPDVPPAPRAPVFLSAIPTVPPTSVDLSTETQEDSKDDLPTKVPINPTDYVIKTELDLAPDVKVNPEENSEVSKDANEDSGSTSNRVVLTGEELGQLVKTDKEIFIEKSTAFFKDDGISRYVPDGVFKCRFCYFAVNYKKQLHLHFKKYHCRENQFKCLICLIHQGRTLTHSTLNELSHHVGTIHLKEKRWVCRICFKSFKSALGRDAHHRKNCSEKDPYACHMCTFTCPTEIALQTHLQKHDASKRREKITCPVCSKTCKATSFASHMSAHTNAHVCVLCKARYPSLTQLKKHYAKTNHQKPYRCEKCRFGAYDEKILQNHMRTAHPVKPTYTCDEPTCSKVFDSERLLNIHKRLHETPEDQWLRCPAKECDFVAVTEIAMKTHLNKTFHHRNFPCPDCTLRFVREESLAQHIQTIHVPRLMKLREKAAQNGQLGQDLGVDDVAVVEQVAASAQNTNHLAGPVEDNPVANFARGWLGISGLGVDGVFDAEDQLPREPPPKDDYHYVTPELSCLVECNQRDEQKESDCEYLDVTPELSCLVQCNQQVGEEQLQKDPSLTDDQDRDEDYHQVTPELSYLVDCNQRVHSETPLQKPSDRDDGYHHVTPELSCLVECNQQEGESVDFKEDPDNEPGLDATFPLVTVEVKEEEQ